MNKLLDGVSVPLPAMKSWWYGSNRSFSNLFHKTSGTSHGLMWECHVWRYIFGGNYGNMLPTMKTISIVLLRMYRQTTYQLRLGRIWFTRWTKIMCETGFVPESRSDNAVSGSTRIWYNLQQVSETILTNICFLLYYWNVTWNVNWVILLPPRRNPTKVWLRNVEINLKLEWKEEEEDEE